MTEATAPHPLTTYLADHLAGAEGALDLIAHLRDHVHDESVRSLMKQLYLDVDADRVALVIMARGIGGGDNRLKEAGAWLAARLARVRMGVGHGQTEGLPLFEAVEAIGLGIQGKIKLWDSIAATGPDPHLTDSAALAIHRANAVHQHEAVEALRQRLAAALFRDAGTVVSP